MVKTVKASSLKTKKQFDEARKKGWNIQFTEPYPIVPKRKKSSKKN